MVETAREHLINKFQEYIRAEIRTSSWETSVWLNARASKVNLVEVPRDLSEPDEALGVRRLTWRGKLEERMSILTKANPEKSYTIALDAEGAKPTGREALFEEVENGLKRRMWDGITITMAQQGVSFDGDNLVIPVYPIDYSEWVACYNPDYATAFKKAKLPLPYAGFGISVLMVTNDGVNNDDRTHGLIPLTRRGIETPVYPGRLYSPGGGPKPGQTSTEAILEEIVEETGLKAGQYFDPKDLFMLALVYDINHGGTEHARPELVAYLPVNTTFSEIERIQYETSLRKGLDQEDVWGVEAFSAYPPNLAKQLVFSGGQMCPPTEAGLAHLLLYQEMRREGLARALANISQMMRRIGSFHRVEFQPPIQRLARP